ncbi:DUF4199 domain-containing protein [Mucilaginibacter sp. McL0603]|uniref:DUF4199 domain-containing protein n=1 Tax=Mucilaginibacter sp. McL0603 TaxID=3415670 RepID=UPI003CECA088
MEQTAPSSAKIAIKWSLIYTLVAIVITYIIEIAKLDINSPIKYLTYIVLLALLFLAQKEHKDKLGGYIKFNEAFITGLLYGVFAGVFTGIFVYIYLTFLSPEMFTQTIEQQREAMAAKGNLSSDQIDQAMEIVKKYGVILGALGAMIVYSILGAIFGLIGAAIFKKERTAYDPEPETTDPAV